MLALHLTILLVHSTSAPITTGCEESQRIELSRALSSPPEVCVSPGVLTTFIFDTPASVDLQQESRFEEVFRGPKSLGIIPPRDMALGERLRLSFRPGNGIRAEEVTLLLVASSEATRQVEVFRSMRTRESFERELKQERAKTQQVIQELTRLRAEVEQFRQQQADPRQLRWLITHGVLGLEGIRARPLPPSLMGDQNSGLHIDKGILYRSEQRVAIALWLVNSTPQPWHLKKASLTASHGRRVPGVQDWQQENAQGDEVFMIIIEMDVASIPSPGEYTLTLNDHRDDKIALNAIELP